MNSKNKVFISGYLGKDAEIKPTNNGSNVISFSVAVTESWKKKDGNWDSRTDWVNVVMFVESEKALEYFTNKLKQGAFVDVEGKVRTETYEKDGVKKTVTKILVDKKGDITFFDLVKKEQSQNNNQNTAAETQEAPTEIDENLPF